MEGEIQNITSQLRNKNSVQFYLEMKARREKLGEDKQQLEARLSEFQASVRCILKHIGEKQDEVEASYEYSVEPFKFGGLTGAIDWGRIHHVMVRECRRLDDGLPIYSYRRKILKEFLFNQVMVLIGETGSGKSTQFVQFLADSGLAGERAIVCTQPRKIATISLAQRVAEESTGCYKDISVVSHPTYSSHQHFNSNVVYMTDHCLLQHCTNNTGLAEISCIIVDEAHERSLNTDLLLAMIKKKLLERSDLRLVIMSATADAQKLADYFDGCCTFHVMGRNFPVEIKYVSDVSTEASYAGIGKRFSGSCASYVTDVVKMVAVIHESEEAGAILAFLTSQMEVEWACENFNDLSAVVLPLHGKLSCEEQKRVFQNYPGKRKVIFATNVAETSLTIEGVKYVVDSGMAKESRFEPSSRMNLLKVCIISQSSANQRAGRAGRTEPGKCYRLYSESDFQSMKMHPEPEIRKVHLGMAVLRILALGIIDVLGFDFVDAPSSEAINSAINNLIQLGAIIRKNDTLKFTETGRRLIKLSIEPQLGKIILDCFDCGLRKEGLVLAAVMANASSIFCRVGNDEEKDKADCLKVSFCHCDGDLFTLLSVYKEWEAETENKNKWCWRNSINAKSMRRCHETVLELENSLKHELNVIVPSYWLWNPNESTVYDRSLKKVILSSLANNVAMYSGYDRLGYQVALSGQYIQLHPSCSLLFYGQKPTWVVFGEILSVSNHYLICVTAIDRQFLYDIQPPLYDVSHLESQKLVMNTITGMGNIVLRRLCGKQNHNLKCITSHVRKVCMDDRIVVDADFDKGEVLFFASGKDVEAVHCMVNDALVREKKWLRDECMEKCLYQGRSGHSPSTALFGSGAEIKHLELDQRYLSVEIFHPNPHTIDDKELLVMVDEHVPEIANFYKYSVSGGQEGANPNRWGKITFLRPEAAAAAVTKLSELELNGSLLKVLPVKAVDHRRSTSFPAVRARVCWPRRVSKGVALLSCRRGDVDFVIGECTDVIIGDRRVRCEVSKMSANAVFMIGVPRDISDSDLYDELPSVVKRMVGDVHIFRGGAVDGPSRASCADALAREISPFMPSRQFCMQNFQVEVFESEPGDLMVRAMITFDGSLHLEAAKALDHLHGKVLPGCLPWQKIECKHMFNTSVSCPARVFHVIRKQLEILLEGFKRREGATCQLDRTEHGSFRVKLSANATKIVSDMRKPVELLMQGKTITHPGLTLTVLQLLFSRDGISLMKALERQTDTYIMLDRRNMQVKIFGPQRAVAAAEEKLVRELLSLNESKQLEIRLRGRNLPPDLMREVVRRFGPDLRGLKDKVPGVDLILRTRGHIISVRGSKGLKQNVEEIISELAQTLDSTVADRVVPEQSCPICLCELEEPYRLEDCKHDFCRACLIDQCDSAMKSRDRSGFGFPICCAKEGCGTRLLLVDLRSLLPQEKLDELFRASLGSFVESSGGVYRFCPFPDCPSVYCVTPSEMFPMGPFTCGACGVETCTMCHLEYHEGISCKLYKDFKDHPDLSLEEWRKGKEQVKDCPSCSHTIEKSEGCNHISCRCGKHICWVCLEVFAGSEDCYEHLRSVHQTIYDEPFDDEL